MIKPYKAFNKGNTGTSSAYHSRSPETFTVRNVMLKHTERYIKIDFFPSLLRDFGFPGEFQFLIYHLPTYKTVKHMPRKI